MSVTTGRAHYLWLLVAWAGPHAFSYHAINFNFFKHFINKIDLFID